MRAIALARRGEELQRPLAFYNGAPQVANGQAFWPFGLLEFHGRRWWHIRGLHRRGARGAAARHHRHADDDTAFDGELGLSQYDLTATRRRVGGAVHGYGDKEEGKGGGQSGSWLGIVLR